MWLLRQKKIRFVDCVFGFQGIKCCHMEEKALDEMII